MSKKFFLIIYIYYLYYLFYIFYIFWTSNRHIDINKYNILKINKLPCVVFFYKVESCVGIKHIYKKKRQTQSLTSFSQQNKWDIF